MPSALVGLRLRVAAGLAGRGQGRARAQLHRGHIAPTPRMNLTPVHPSRPTSPHARRWVEQGDGGRALVPECSHAGHVLALYLATRGDLVVVGE